MAEKRFLFIDFLRFMAIFFMFWDHSLKLFYHFKTSQSLNQFFTNLSLKIIGITSVSSALFLFLVGFCLVLSFNQWSGKKSVWFFKKFKKGAWLIFLSYLLFFYKFGLGEKKAIATSGILQLIGVGLVGGALLFFLRRKARVGLLILLNFSSLMLDLAMRIKKIEAPPLNVYIFPLLPNISFIFSGMLMAEGYLYWTKEAGQKYLKNLLLGSLVVATLFLSATNFDPFLIFGSRYRLGGFWQPSIDLVIFNTVLITATLSILALFEEKLKKFNLVRKMSLFGQEALNIYVLHIFLGWGVSKHLLKEAVFGFWAPLLAMMAFLTLGWQWVKFRGINENY